MSGLLLPSTAVLSFSPPPQVPLDAETGHRLIACWSHADCMLIALGWQVPLDAETGHRLTSNPLMLAVAIAIFEQQRERRWEEMLKAAAAEAAKEEAKEGARDGAPERAGLRDGAKDGKDGAFKEAREAAGPPQRDLVKVRSHPSRCCVSECATNCDCHALMPAASATAIATRRLLVCLPS